MMLPNTYLRARKAAHHHVQVEITAISLPSVSPGEAIIQARVGTVFRSAGSLSVDDSVEFELSVTRSMDDIPPGPAFWVPAEVVGEGCWIEVFLNGEPPACAVAKWQSQAIDGPTPGPVMSLTEL